MKTCWWWKHDWTRWEWKDVCHLYQWRECKICGLKRSKYAGGM